MISFDSYELSNHTYGGLSCMKVGLRRGDNYYLVKFPNKIKGMKNVNISYANDVYSEYIASHVASHYIETHEVELGLYQGKVCAVCKDFCGESRRLHPYSELKTTMSREILKPNGEISLGLDPDIEAVQIVLAENNMLRSIPNVGRKFWIMFIVDAINGNPDRNNGNWGVLRDGDSLSYAPLYDNGNALNSKYSDVQLSECLEDSARFKALAYSGFRCFFTEDEKRINPFHYLESGISPAATEALLGMDLNYNPNSIIDDLDISDVRKEFYKKMYTVRYAELRRIKDMLTDTLADEELAMWEQLPESLRAGYTGSRKELLRDLSKWR